MVTAIIIAMVFNLRKKFNNKLEQRSPTLLIRNKVRKPWTKLERIKNLGRSKINYKKPGKNKPGKCKGNNVGTCVKSEETTKPIKIKPMKPTADQEQLASVLAMELSSLMFFFDHFPKITQTQVDQMLNKEQIVIIYWIMTFTVTIPIKDDKNLY